MRKAGAKFRKAREIMTGRAGLGTKVRRNMATKTALEQEGALYNLQRLQERADRYDDLAKQTSRTNSQ